MLIDSRACARRLAPAIAATSAIFALHAAPAFAADTTPPSAPTALAAAPTASNIGLTWKASTDNVGIKGYDVWRKVANTTSWSLIATVSTTSDVDATATSGTSYVYAVRAYDTAGNTSAASAFLSAQETTAPPPPPISGSVLFKGDAESPIQDEWGEINDVGITSGQAAFTTSGILSHAKRTSLSSSIVEQGKSSYHFQVQGQDRDYYNTSTRQRTELGMALPYRTMSDGVTRLFKQGDDRWISFAMYLPSDFTLSQASNSVLQIKQTAGTGNPVLNLDASAGGWRLFRAADMAHNTGLLASRAAKENVWARFTMHIHFSKSASDGYVEWYGNLGDAQGWRTLLPRYSTWTLKTDSSGNSIPSALRIGLYRATSSQTSDLFVDGLTVATSRAAAEANAFGSGASATSATAP